MRRAAAGFGLALGLLTLAACERERTPAPAAGWAVPFPQPRDAVSALQRAINNDDCGAAYDVSTLDFHAQITRKDWIAQCRRMAADSGAWMNSTTLSRGCSVGRFGLCDYEGVLNFEKGRYRLSASWKVDHGLLLLNYLSLESENPKVKIASALLPARRSDPADWRPPRALSPFPHGPSLVDPPPQRLPRVDGGEASANPTTHS
jgi:hypothetical protein